VSDSLSGAAQHRRHEVDTDDFSGRPDRFSEVREIRAGATAHLDDGIAGREVE
jgi:hypothetical protein